jgi:hypothetical protein
MVKRILVIIIVVLFFLCLAFACNTKKQITKEATKTETQTTTTLSTSQASQANGISITDTRTIGRILEENRIVFDSIAEVRISPDGTITAKGNKPVIHRSKRSESLTHSKALVDTTRSTAVSTDFKEDKTESIESNTTRKDLKRRPAFLAIAIVVGLCLLIYLIIIGLKKASIF